MTNNPFDLLKKSRKRRVLEIGAAVLVGLLVLAAIFGVKAAVDYRAEIQALQSQTEEDRAAITEQTQIARQAATEAADSAQDAQDAVDSKAATEAAAAAEEAAAEAEEAARAAEETGPVRCPAGTVAGAFDDAGNESNCQPLNDSGKQCVAYDDNNVCTAWEE